MIKNYFFTAVIALLFSTISFSQEIADYNVLLIQGNTTTHEDVMDGVGPLGHILTPVPYADVIDGFDFSPYDVAIFMWDTPMTFTGLPDLIAENEACNIGVISMSHTAGMASLGLGTGDNWTDETFGIINNTHWITEPWAVGALPLEFTYKVKLTNIPDGVTALGVTGSDTALVVHDTYKRASCLYYGHTSGMPWNADAASLIDRIICWAASSCCELTTDLSVTDYTITALQDDATYQWIDCADDSEIDGATSQTFEPAENGDYACIVTITEDCTDTTDCASIVALGINDRKEVLYMNIFPNPSKGQFTIQSNQAEQATIVVFDNSGRIVMETEMMNEILIDLNLEAGVYFIQYTSANNSAISRFIIE
ncbi:MAG: T9SS type A sorting domain-containing protein [Crocinitomix sp.]|nr:T9SS type A sorting domain-containing protein [Crocinitomix sp.]